MAKKTTISMIKCDVGSLAGHHIVAKPLMDVGERHLKKAKEKGLINSYYVFNAFSSFFSFSEVFWKNI